MTCTSKRCPSTCHHGHCQASSQVTQTRQGSRAQGSALDFNTMLQVCFGWGPCRAPELVFGVPKTCLWGAGGPAGPKSLTSEGRLQLTRGTHRSKLQSSLMLAFRSLVKQSSVSERRACLEHEQAILACLDEVDDEGDLVG